VLKGAASFFVKIFDDPGSRVMVDLDILVPQKAAEDCWNILHILAIHQQTKIMIIPIITISDRFIDLVITVRLKFIGTYFLIVPHAYYQPSL